MSDNPANITEDEWFDHIFNHPIPGDPEDAWYWHEDPPTWEQEADPDHLILLLADTFSFPKKLNEQYSRDQIGQGLHYLVSPPCSDHAFLMTDGSIDLDLRLRCVREIGSLYRSCFAELCDPVLGHLQQGGEKVNELNCVCYMFWDVIPMYPRSAAKQSSAPKRRQRKRGGRGTVTNSVEQACIEVMQESLRLDHPACQESALHGLGHWCYGFPDTVESSIGSYLGQSSISSELRAYARAARTGCIL